jgi:hypothetical protein
MFQILDLEYLHIYSKYIYIYIYMQICMHIYMYVWGTQSKQEIHYLSYIPYIHSQPEGSLFLVNVYLVYNSSPVVGV